MAAQVSYFRVGSISKGSACPKVKLLCVLPITDSVSLFSLLEVIKMLLSHWELSTMFGNADSEQVDAANPVPCFATRKRALD